MSKPTREEFYLYKRKCKSGCFWYVKYIDPATALIQTAKSIDVLKEQLGYGCTTTVRSKTRAAVIAQKALDSGIIFGNGQKVLFNDFCREFWDYDNSTYVKTRNAIKPGSLGREYCKNMQINFNLHVAPEFSEKLRIQNVSMRSLDSVVRKLLNEGNLSNGTIQLVVISFKEPLKEAVRQGLIASNPAENLMKIVRKEEPRGILTYEECLALCAKAEELYKKGELYPTYYFAIALAISTGMRSGEIRALKAENIISTELVNSAGEKLDRIIICQSIAPYTGIKCPKGKYQRQLCIPHVLAEKLRENADEDGRVFPSRYGGFISAPTLARIFASILEKIGIDEKSQSERKLTFHSLRHVFSTLSRDNEISQEDRMLVMGHKSKRVNEIYTHVTDKQLERVSDVTSTIVNLFGIK